MELIHPHYMTSTFRGELPWARSIIKEADEERLPYVVAETLMKIDHAGRMGALVGKEKTISFSGGTATTSDVTLGAARKFAALFYALVEHGCTLVENPTSYEQVFRDTALWQAFALVKEFMAGGFIDRALTLDTIAFHNVNYHFVANFIRCGSKVYELAPGLADTLRHTELHGLLTDDLKLPYDALFLKTPPVETFQLYNDISGWHDISGAYIMRDPLLRLKLEPDSPQVGGWRLSAIGKSKTSDPTDDAVVQFSVPLPPGRKLDEVLDDAEIGSAIKGSNEMRARVLPLFRWVMNAMIYATWPDAEVDHVWMSAEARSLWERIQKLPKVSKKRDKLKARLRGLDTTKVTYLGRSVKKVGGEATGGGVPLNKVVIVPGHWRHVWIGKRGAQTRVRRFIRPYTKGPDGAALSNPIHVLRGRETESGSET